MTSILIVNSWPESLPLPVVDFSGAARESFMISDVNAALISRRSRSHKTYGSFTAVWMLGTTQRRAFETFYDVTLGCGVAIFSMDLRYPKASGLTNWGVRFGDGGYDEQYIEGIWQVSAKLELIYPTLLSAGADDPNAGFESFLLAGEESGTEESLFDSDGQEVFVLPE